MMDEDQSNAFELVKNGHNVIITGQAGTGKTYLVKRIVENQRKNKKNVSIVCSTGIAATHYGDLGAQTLHKWSGIEDGRHLNEEIVHLVKTDERFINAKKNIENVDVLIVDEVSMISVKVLNQVQTLCKEVRKSKELFGQIQVVLVGDFYQLPPVANQLHGDSGKPCFLLPWFDAFFPHKVILHEIHRQEDTNLIQSINELEIGDPSDNTVAFLNSLDRPMKNEEKCIQLFARNLDVDLFNFDKINQLDGELKTYKATDEGSEHYLSKFLAPKNLALKVGCPVMLVQNRSNELVNGLRGFVTKLLPDSVEVKFTMEKRTITTNIGKTTFTTFDPVKKIVIAKRIQLPLKLAYAMTVHKSQGMSLENVVVNCQNCFQAGQLGVAVGRAVSVEGLKVVNFKKSLCKQHPLSVKQFHQNISVGDVKADLTCCQKKIQQDVSSEDKNDEPSDTNMQDSDFSDSEIEQLTFLDNFIETNILTVEESVSPSKVALDSVVTEFLDTPREERMLSFKQKVLCDFQKFEDWFKVQFSMVEDIGLNCFPEDETKFSQKHRNNFFTKFHKYVNSVEYENSVVEILTYYKVDTDGPEFQLFTSIMFYLERKSFESLSAHLQLDTVEPIKNILSHQDLDSSARGKIRYVGGYVVAKLKYITSKKLRNALFAEGMESKVVNLKSQMTILNSLCASYDVVKEITSDPESLNITQRKQNERESLTNICDPTFDFFMKLEVICRDKLSHENLVEIGKNLFDHVKDELCKNSQLFELWTETMTKMKVSAGSTSDDINTILCSIVTMCENYIEIFYSVLDLFLKVSLSQFRRDYLTFLKKEKGKALRKKVMDKSKKTTKCFNMKFFNEDKSTNKEVSHLRLKSEMLQNEKFLLLLPFTKQDLLSLCVAYRLKLSSNKKKEDINNALVKAILKNDTLPQIDVHVPSISSDEAVAGPSGMQQVFRPIQEEFEVASPSGISQSLTSDMQEARPDQTSQSTTPTVSVGDSDYEVPKAVKKGRKRKLQTKGKKGKGKGKNRRTCVKETTESDENCGVCNATYIEGEQWICCDTCSLWFHRNCVQIHDEEEWSHFTDDGEPFSCPMCQ